MTAEQRARLNAIRERLVTARQRRATARQALTSANNSGDAELILGD